LSCEKENLSVITLPNRVNGKPMLAFNILWYYIIIYWNWILLICWY
jgi:hypothetical protein